MDAFVWDESKSAENRALRGIGFEIIHEVEWSVAVFEDDARFDYGERRVRAFARVGERPYCMVLVPRDGTIRVLSVRRMHEKEARRYGV